MLSSLGRISAVPRFLGWALLAQVLLAGGIPPAAHAEVPADRGEISLTRNVGTASPLRGRLIKNVYRNIERQIVENIQVPYQVDVPYEEAETYYVDQRVCDNRPHQQCNNQSVCRQVEVPEQVCHNERRCFPDGHCTDQPVCKTVMKHENRCAIEPVCRTVSVYECWVASVPRTRIVVRHRIETRYRTEQRTRTVTEAVFDHAWSANVAVLIPGDSLLQGQEEETILVRLVGSEQSPAVEVQVDSPVYSYRLADQNRVGSEIQARLEQVAKYKPEDLAEQTIENLVMVPRDGKNVVQFVDKGIVARTTTQYWISVVDRDTGKTLFEGQAAGSFGQGLVSIPVDASIEADHDHLLRLTVRREGKVISAPVQFVKAADQVGQLDPAPYEDTNSVREFTIEGVQDQASLVFIDATPKDHKVDTSYEIKLRRRRPWYFFGTIATIAEATLKRENLKHDDDNHIRVPLSEFPGVSAEDLQKYFDDGDKVIVQVKVIRVSPRLQGSSPIEFDKEAKIQIKK